MTRLLTAGAELGHLSGDPGLITPGSAPIVSSPVHSGGFAYSNTTAGNFLRFNYTKTPNRWLYSRCWFRVTAIPAVSTSSLIAAVFDALSTVWNVYLRSDGTLSQSNVVPGASPFTPPIAVDQWNCLEVGVWGDSTTSRRIILRLNGVQFDDFSTSSTPTSYGDSVRWGWISTAPGTIYFDDIAVNDDTGGDQNSWPGASGAIVLLKPVSDQAVGADWKLGTGTNPSANAFDSLNNVPPVGVANGVAGSDPKQIRDVVSNITAPASDADIKLAAYSTVMPSDSVVRVAQAVAVAAHSSNTVAQDIEFGLVSGPSESRPTINLPINAAGTYPTNWRNARGNVLYDPSVASTDQPVLRLGKRTASTVAHLCCLMGVQIEYEPSANQRFMAVA